MSNEIKKTDNNEAMVSLTEDTWKEAFDKENWVLPEVNLLEDDEAFFVYASMPGVKKDDVRIKLENGNLVLMGRIDRSKQEGKKILLKEINTGNFYRKFKVADSIDTESVDASFQDGQLVLRLAKHERIKPKTIEIK
ncbi:MAG: Hsp20/alpha crystallin family protein [Bacteroidetes bacterium]|nr:Hsp20/alpha crystallin family protein [Bacteroidota bacterium]